MPTLPDSISAIINKPTTDLKVIFEVEEGQKAVFIFVNQSFLRFHGLFRISLKENDVLKTTLDSYFRNFLGFTDEEINSRMQTLQIAIDTKKPYSFKEISEIPNAKPLILETTWSPIEADGRTYVVWTSREFEGPAK